tara:strand:- start:3298 stop:4359 length:1062 start_codon:yes stop_codon:yes gene_type:complete
MDIDSLQPKISQRIQTIVEKNKIANAYLLHGSEGSGKEAVALKFSSLLTDCSIDEFLDNPNIFFIIPASTDFYSNFFKSKKIDEKEYQEWNQLWREKLLFPLKKIRFNSNNIPLVALKNLKENIIFESDKRKIVIIFDAHCLSHGSSESANALLKLLEEPPSKTSFILVTDYMNSIPATIQSRCQIISIPKIGDKDLKKYIKRTGDLDFELLSFLSGNNLQLVDLFIQYSKSSLINIIHNYINAIEYSNSQSISEFYEKILANINTNKENLYLDFHIIKKWLEYTNQIKSSISHSFSWDEFHDISDNFINNHQNCEIENLIKEIEYFLGDIEQNTNPKFSLMNMFINSHNYLN